MSAAWSQPPRSDDRLAPARGIACAIAISLALWALIIGGLLWMTGWWAAL